jgi:phosphogluconate dehydratase
MLMEFMGLQLPGSSFVNPGTPLRDALTDHATEMAADITALGNSYTPVSDILSEKAFVNGIVGLMATGGSTNLVIHLPAMARAAGVILDIEDFNDLSAATPLMAKVYPNGLADVNHFHAAGGLQFLIDELLGAGLLHQDVRTVAGDGLGLYTFEPEILRGGLHYREGPSRTENDKILRPASDPFQSTGGLRELKGNLGRSVMKVSAVATQHQVVEAPVRVFDNQDSVKAAFKAGEFTQDTVIAVRFQGPRANGMPELHGLTPTLSVLLSRGLNVALITDGRMSGASGKVPAAIHLSPEAAIGGPIAKLRDGDIVRVDAATGTLSCLEPDFDNRTPTSIDLSTNETGLGRELFAAFRTNCCPASDGGAIVV